MKRLLILTLTMIVTALCWAASPKLASVEIFDRKDLRAKGYSMMKSTSENKRRFMNLTAQNDKKLLADVKEAVDQDRKQASNVVEGFENGKDYIILNIPREGGKISIIFNWTDEGMVDFSISGPSEFFKN